jgi:hypothetical protein
MPNVTFITTKIFEKYDEILKNLVNTFCMHFVIASLVHLMENDNVY